MNALYPLKFTPIFKDKIWGGDKIKTRFNMDFAPLPNCGEAWIVSGYDNNNTIVENGFLQGNELNELIEVYMGDLVGEANYERFGNQFPILVKILDSKDWLSIQVHPDDELAQRRGYVGGKTEMWYILDADPGSQLISGFNQSTNIEAYTKLLQDNTLQSVLNYETVEKGDCFYMPAGRVHALGPGILLAEIQQTSDTTYRIFDWNRVDDKGQARELHLEEAMDAIDFSAHEKYRTDYKAIENGTTSLVTTPYFTTNMLKLTQAIEKDYAWLDSFVILLVAEGAVRVDYGEEMIDLVAGEALLVPAVIDQLRFFPSPQCTCLEVFIDSDEA
jgi:mannose-6-phosphate isomerase